MTCLERAVTQSGWLLYDCVLMGGETQRGQRAGKLKGVSETQRWQEPGNSKGVRKGGTQRVRFLAGRKLKGVRETQRGSRSRS